MTVSAIDLETLRLVASEAAREAVLTVSIQIRADNAEAFKALDKAMEERRHAYFGSKDPSQHVIQHDRIDRLLNLLDGMSKNILGQILSKLIWGLIIAAIFGYFLWMKITGGHGA